MNKDYCKHMVPLMKNDTCHICSLEAERDRLRKELEEAKQSIVEEVKQADGWHELYLAAHKELENERKQAAAVRKAMQDVLYYLQRDSVIPAQDIIEQYLAMGQEGEGNQ